MGVIDFLKGVGADRQQLCSVCQVLNVQLSLNRNHHFLKNTFPHYIFSYDLVLMHLPKTFEQCKNCKSSKLNFLWEHRVLLCVMVMLWTDARMQHMRTSKSYASGSSQTVWLFPGSTGAAAASGWGLMCEEEAMVNWWEKGSARLAEKEMLKLNGGWMQLGTGLFWVVYFLKIHLSRATQIMLGNYSSAQ